MQSIHQQDIEKITVFKTEQCLYEDFYIVPLIYSGANLDAIEINGALSLTSGG